MFFLKINAFIEHILLIYKDNMKQDIF